MKPLLQRVTAGGSDLLMTRRARDREIDSPLTSACATADGERSNAPMSAGRDSLTGTSVQKCRLRRRRFADLGLQLYPGNLSVARIFSAWVRKAGNWVVRSATLSM
jgi:hypothetical protein